MADPALRSNVTRMPFWGPNCARGCEAPTSLVTSMSSIDLQGSSDGCASPRIVHTEAGREAAGSVSTRGAAGGDEAAGDADDARGKAMSGGPTASEAGPQPDDI